MDESDIGNCPLYVTLRMSDRAVLEQVIELHSDDDTDVETITISNPCLKGTQPTVVDLGGLTRTQWETLEIAYMLGHYSGKRGGNLDKIAAELNITKSAASQRLRSAESRVIDSVMGTGSLTCDELSEEFDRFENESV